MPSIREPIEQLFRITSSSNVDAERNYHRSDRETERLSLNSFSLTSKLHRCGIAKQRALDESK